MVETKTQTKHKKDPKHCTWTGSAHDAIRLQSNSSADHTLVDRQHSVNDFDIIVTAKKGSQKSGQKHGRIRLRGTLHDIHKEARNRKVENQMTANTYTKGKLVPLKAINSPSEVVLIKSFVNAPVGHNIRVVPRIEGAKTKTFGAQLAIE
jgi:hypothetical protein